MATTHQITATIEAHVAAVGATDAHRLAALYAPGAHLFDPAGGTPVEGRDAIREHFATVLTEPRRMGIVLIAVTGADAALHFRATPATGDTVEVIDTMTFDEQARITSMRAYARHP